jgi:hypothetical protein
MRRLLATIPLAVLVVTGTTATLPAAGAEKAPKGVTATISLPSRTARAGRDVKGKLVLKNSGSTTVDLRDVCTPKWQAVLGKGRTAPPVAFTMECGVDPFPVKPGTTKLPFTLSTRYGGCTKDATQVTADLPRCGADGLPPALRTGRYRVFLVANQSSFPTAAPVRLRLVRR